MKKLLKRANATAFAAIAMARMATIATVAAGAWSSLRKPKTRSITVPRMVWPGPV
jgi:hypothetical protein